MGKIEKTKARIRKLMYLGLGIIITGMVAMGGIMTILFQEDVEVEITMDGIVCQADEIWESEITLIPGEVVYQDMVVFKQSDSTWVNCTLSNGFDESLEVKFYYDDEPHDYMNFTGETTTFQIMYRSHILAEQGTYDYTISIIPESSGYI